jgi:putative tricarboxylic transport membrane protein
MAFYSSKEAAETAAGALKDWDHANKEVKLGAIGLVYKEEGEIKTHVPRKTGRGIAVGAPPVRAFLWLGFVIANTIMVVFVGRLFGGSWVKAVITGVAMSVLFFLLFDKVLDVVLPTGLLGGLL